MRALVLAAGFATRLHPLTRDRAKPLLDVAGKPVLTRLLEDSVLRAPGIVEVVVVANHRFHGQFEEWSRQASLSVPVRLLDDGATCDEDRKGGVADLALAWADSASRGEDDVLVVAGDNLFEFSMEGPAGEFQRHRLPMMLVRHFPDGAPPRRFGEVMVDESFAITGFREKPERPESPYAATCVYFFPPTVRPLLTRYLDDGGERDAPGHFLAWLSARTRVQALPMPGRAHDIGNLETLEAARRSYSG